MDPIEQAYQNGYTVGFEAGVASRRSKVRSHAAMIRTLIRSWKTYSKEGTEHRRTLFARSMNRLVAAWEDKK